MTYPARVEFECRTDHTSDDDIERNIRHALSLRLPEADAEPLPLLRVFANGPSALRAPLDGASLALNGALGLFPDGPTFWAACDPQSLVADFVSDPPERTIYYVASKCHPDVFEALKHRDVRLWHPNDYPIPGKRQVRHGSSVTLTVPNLFRYLGWRRFEFWGWDCCLLDGQHHAVPIGELPDQIECKIGERTFATRHAWACEAEEAAFMLQIVDYEYEIMGDGMVKAYMEDMKNG